MTITNRSIEPWGVVVLTILAGLCQALPLAATTIVAVRVDSMVVIAADSFQLDLGRRQDAERSCKIVRVGNSAAAAAG